MSSIYIPTGAKKLDSLSEIERNVYLSAIYLITNETGHEHILPEIFGTDKNWFKSEDLQRIYKEQTDKDIDVNTLYKILYDFRGTHIDFSKSKYFNQVGNPEIIRIKEEQEFCLVLGDYYPVVRLFQLLDIDTFKTKNDQIERFDFKIRPESKKALLAIFYNEKDVTFWKLIYNDEEKGDLTFKEFCDYENEQISKQEKNGEIYEQRPQT